MITMNDYKITVKLKRKRVGRATKAATTYDDYDASNQSSVLRSLRPPFK